MFVHSNWIKAGFLDKIKNLASRRNFKDLTLSPLLSLTNDQFHGHINSILQMPGTSLLFGNHDLHKDRFPNCYGFVDPTAVMVPIDHFLNDSYTPRLFTELFGPFQMIVEYNDNDLNEKLLKVLERIPYNLTEGVVSNDPIFQTKILGIII